RLTITRPDDWHLHVRDGAGLTSVVPHSAAAFARAIIMPNLQPPIRTTEQALAYRERILAAVPADVAFEPLMTLYLTDTTPVEEIARAKASGCIVACKLYPAGATTNSEHGVTGVEHIYPVLEAMTEEGLLLLVHGEVVDPSVDIFDREKVFIDRVLGPLLQRMPKLKVVFEHLTTKDGVTFVRSTHGNVGATITPHHLLHSRNAMLVGGIRPHLYCLPIIKREEHRKVLVEAATSGDSRFFLGTDSAPHPLSSKECACGCAGVFNAHAALPVCASVFQSE
ncbi:MAG: dihydroorotase, partial [bacterium]|nr:dihydroorotase [bacterium]